MSVVTMPRVCVRSEERLRAIALGTYSSSRIARRTRSRVAGATVSSPLITRETVWCETPARRATSRMVARLASPRGRPLGTARFSAISLPARRRLWQDPLDAGRNRRMLPVTFEENDTWPAAWGPREGGTSHNAGREREDDGRSARSAVWTAGGAEARRRAGGGPRRRAAPPRLPAGHDDAKGRP